MALVLADRVKETSTTTGTGTYTLAGAVTGFESFASIGNGNTTYYACTLGSDFEVGIGTYTSSGTTLARTTILQSSNSDNAVNWGAGEKILFCTQPAEKAVFRDASGHIIALDGRNLTSLNASEISSGTLSEDRLPDGGAGAATYGSTSDATKIDTITLDAKGRVTAVATGNTGDILGVTAGTGLSGGGTGGTVTLALDFSELTDMTADISGTTEFILQDGTTESRKAASEIGLSAFDNDAGFTTNTGDITGVTAGTGLSGGGSSGGVTLAVDLSELTDMTQTIVGTDEFIVLDNGADRRKAANEIPLSIFNNDSAFITASTTDTLTNKTLTNPTINAFSGTGDASITGDLTLTSTDAGSGEDPNLKLFRNSSSPADSDNIGTIQFQGKNDADQTTTFAEIQSQISDVTDGTEDGVLYFQVRRNGTLTSIANISGSSGRFNISNGDLFLQTGAELVFEGATSDAHETTLTVTDPTADRTITLPNATGTVSLLTNTETLTNKTLTTPVINGFSGTGDGSIIGDLTLTSTDAGATENPTLDLYRNSASPADNDVLGHIHFSGENDADQKVAYGEIEMRALDVSDGTEDGRLVINSILNGTTVTHYATGFGFNQFFKDVLFAQNINMQFEGATNDGVRTTLTVTDPTSSRTITLPDADGTVLLNTGDQTITGNLTLTATDDTSGSTPEIKFVRQSASPADFDYIGGLSFFADNSADQNIEFGTIEARLRDVTDGTEDFGGFELFGIRGGVARQRFMILNEERLGFMNYQFLRFEDGSSNHFTISPPSSLSTSQTITLPDATGTVLLADGDGSSLTNVNATTLDSVDSTSFLRSDAADTKTSGNLQFSDNVRLRLGSSGSSDLQIWHDGTNSNIVNGTGDLIIGDSTGDVKIQGKYGEQSIIANNDGSVELYHDNSKKLETASGGISVTGEIAATSLDISGDVDVDGTLEADAITLNGTSLAASATTDTTNASNIGSGTLPNARLASSVLTTSNSDAPATTTSSSDADFVLVDDGGTMKKITPANLGITSGGTTAAFATAMAMVL